MVSRLTLATTSARIIRSVPLLYADGADASLDRPAHVRSASGLTRVAGCIAALVFLRNYRSRVAYWV